MKQLESITDQSQNPQESLLKQREQAKKSNQLRAIFFKTASLQSKQIGTNICQILTPIICLLFTFIIKVIVQANLNMDDQYFQSIPIPLNVQLPEFAQDYISLRCLQWYEYSLENENINRAFVGVNDGKNTSRSGFLGNSKIVNDSCEFKYDDINDRGLTTPFQRQNNNSKGLVNDLVDRLVYLRNAYIKNQTAVLPDGAVRFHSLSEQEMNATILINDCRTFDYHRPNGVTAMRLRPNTSVKYQWFITVPEGQLTFVDLLNSAYSKTVANKSINTALIYFPVVTGSQMLINNIINMVASTIFPISLSLLLPVFLYAIVLQKQQKLIQMMRMNGMKMRYFWLVNFLFNLMLSTITAFIFYLFGRFVLKNSFFVDTNFFLQFLTLFGWMLAQIGMATLFQTFISKSSSANIIGYLLSIWTSMIAASLNVGLYQYPKNYPYALKMYAPFSFNRIMYIILSKCSMDSCPTSMSGLDTQIIQCLVYMYLNFVIFQLMGMYLYQVIPQQYGIARSPLYPIKGLIQWIKGQTARQETAEDTQRFNYMNLNDEDPESLAERNKVNRMSPQQISQYPLVVNNLRKLYKKQGMVNLYPAVKSFNLTVEHNQIFGLLGPNGAGKTTLISMITGMFSSNYGNAWVGGYSVNQEIQKVHLEMGVCPQFDLLWPMLTIEEHLLFYARLKGIKKEQQHQKVKQALEQVNLTEFRTFKARQLSGGMKRRLSVAISLVGDPQIVFMDEPTTGLDPENRRDLWSVLAKCRLKRSVFLTTHMMDEADTLCNRIGIITTGALRTVGNQIMLRNKYGGGYKLDINLCKQQRQKQKPQQLSNLNKSILLQDQSSIRELSQLTQVFEQQPASQQQKSNPQFQRLKQFMKTQFPLARLTKQFNNNFSYSLGSSYMVSEIFQKLHDYKDSLEIQNWGVINSSLEDVFLTVVKQFDKEILDEVS